MKPFSSQQKSTILKIAENHNLCFVETVIQNVAMIFEILNPHVAFFSQLFLKDDPLLFLNV